MRRVLEQYPALIPYFTDLCVRDPTSNHDMILTELKKLSTKIYFEFMAYSLNLFNEFNTFFQAELPLLHLLRGKAQELVETLASNYTEDQYVRSFNNPLDIDPSAEQHFLPEFEIYLGKCIY